MSFINIDILKFEKKLKKYDSLLENMNKKVEELENRLEREKRKKIVKDNDRIYLSISGLRRASVFD
jgi:hypothetical protein